MNIICITWPLYIILCQMTSFFYSVLSMTIAFCLQKMSKLVKYEWQKYLLLKWIMVGTYRLHFCKCDNCKVRVLSICSLKLLTKLWKSKNALRLNVIMKPWPNNCFCTEISWFLQEYLFTILLFFIWLQFDSNRWD